MAQSGSSDAVTAGVDRMGQGATGSHDTRTDARAYLTSFVDTFLDGLLKHDASKLPLAPNCRTTFNGKEATLDGEIWQCIDKISFRQYLADPEAGQVVFFGIAEEVGKRGTFFLRLKVVDGRLTELEMLAGDRMPNGALGLISVNPLYDCVLPLAHQRSREQLVAIADSYFEGLERHDGANVPVTPDCRRFEDGVQTSLNPMGRNTLANDLSSYDYMDRVKERFYPIVDIERGLVFGGMVIEVSKPPTHTFASTSPLFFEPHDTIIREIFKVIDGRIAEIQAIRLDRPYMWGGGW
jgi:hypothetical protein